MNTSYPIGALADKIIAMKIRYDGTFTRLVRRRTASGRMIDEPVVDSTAVSQRTRAQFFVRVRPGDSGIVCRESIVWPVHYGADAIPLGRAGTFDDDELAKDSAPLNGSAPSNPDEVMFRFEDGKLTWEFGNVSGMAVLNAAYPELMVSLRLPPGNEGEISFASPLFTTADGEPASVLSVA